jgi:hypothetical protein
MTTTSFKLHQVQVFENKNGYPNVIGLVRWAIHFERESLVSVAGVETMLETNNIQNFTPIEQLTREQVLDMAYTAQGGAGFLATIQPYHEEDLDQQEQRVGLVPYTGIPVDQAGAYNPPNTIPQQVL